MSQNGKKQKHKHLTNNLLTQGKIISMAKNKKKRKNKLKRIAIIGTVGVPAKYGGFETLVDNLVERLASDYKITVYCSKKNYTKTERVKYYKGAKLVYLPFSANGAQSIIYDIISIFHSLFIADTLLILGVSGGIVVPFVRWFTNKKIIVNIDGQEWKRDKWNLYITLLSLRA